MSLAPPSVSTPCVKLCVVDGESGLCLGCLRTLPEIAQWGALEEESRKRLMLELPSRRGRIRPEKLALFS